MTVSGAVHDYLEHLVVERGLAGNTVESYRRDLRRYESSLAERGKAQLGDVTSADVAEFLASLREGDAEHEALAVSSAARAVIAVRGLHAYAAAQGLTGTDPARDITPPTPPRRLPKAITVAEVERLLRLEESASAGSCPHCAAPHSRGALFCWQCGATLMERAASTVAPPAEDQVTEKDRSTAVMDALLAPKGARASESGPFADE